MNFNYTAQSDTIKIISGDGTVSGVEYGIDQVTLIKDCVVTINGRDYMLGTAVGKQLVFTIDTTEIIEGTRFQYLAAIQDDEETQVTTFVGNFTAVDTQPNATTSLVTVTAIDEMINFSVPYMSALDYEASPTIWDVVTEMCANCGVTLAADQPEALQNTGFIVGANRFTNGELCRSVLMQAAMVMGAFAQIVNSELVFVVPDTTGTSVPDVSTTDYETLQLQRTIRQYNNVTIRSSLNDDDIESMTADPAGEAPEPEIALIVEDNEFLYNAATRTAAIAGIFNNAVSFGYYPFEARGLAHPALNCGDMLAVKDENGVEYRTFLLHMEYHSADESQGSNDVLSAPSVTITAVPYQYTASPEMQLAKKAYSTALNAQTSANGKNTVYYSATEPTGGVYIDGDIWFDTANGNKVNVYQGGAWTAVQYGTAAFAAGAITAESGIIGSLDAAVITAGTMSASRIKGDSLVLGGNANEFGLIIIKDATGNIIGVWDNEGLALQDPDNMTHIILITPTGITFDSPGGTSVYNYGGAVIQGDVGVHAKQLKLINAGLEVGSLAAEDDETITATGNFNFTGNVTLNGDDIAHATGWTPVNETWTYSSVDDPIAVIAVPSGHGITVGMRVKYTANGQTMNGIVVAYTSTSITVLLEIDPADSLALYTPSTGHSITNPYYSPMKAPQGFPLDPRKWTVLFAATADVTTNSPTQNTWYPVYSLVVPIGAWSLSYEALIGVVSTANQTAVRVSGTLSTTNNSETDTKMSIYQGLNGAAGTLVCIACGSKTRDVIVATKTTYYFLYRTISASAAVASLVTAYVNQPIIIKATCSYL